MQGFPMRVPTRDGLIVEMRPAKIQDAVAYAAGFSSYPVSRTLTIRSAMSVDHTREGFIKARL